MFVKVLLCFAANLDVRLCLLEFGIPIFSTAVLFVFLAFDALTPTYIGCLLSTPSTSIAKWPSAFVSYRGSEGLPLPLPYPPLWLRCGCVSCFESATLEKYQASKAAVGFPRRSSSLLVIDHHLTAYLSVFYLPYREARLPRMPSASSCFDSRRLQSVIDRR